MASLVGVTFGAPVVAFEAPGERMAAQRLHLPSPVRVASPLIYGTSQSDSHSPRRST